MMLLVISHGLAMLAGIALTLLVLILMACSFDESAYQHRKKRRNDFLSESKNDEMKNRAKTAVIAEYETVVGENVIKHTEPVRAVGESCQDIQQRVDALARQYLETHAPEIIRQMNELSRRLDELKETA